MKVNWRSWSTIREPNAEVKILTKMVEPIRKLNRPITVWRGDAGDQNHWAQPVCHSAILFLTCGVAPFIVKFRMPLAPGSSVSVGPHTIVREDAITRVILRGTIEYEHIERMLAEYQGMIDEQGFALIMMDMHDGGDMAMPARRKATQWGSQQGHCIRSAVVGGSFFLRNAIQLLNRATHLMSGNAAKITFVQTDEEARAWLMAQIPILARKNPAS